MDKYCEIEKTFHALADITRLEIIDALGAGEKSVSELYARRAMALPSFMKHIGVLEDCGLIKTVKNGRVRTVSLQEQNLIAIEHWVQRRRNQWKQKLAKIEEFLNGEGMPNA